MRIFFATNSLYEFICKSDTKDKNFFKKKSNNFINIMDLYNLKILNKILII